MLTVLEIIRKTTDFFARREIPSPRLNAELLVGHALGLKRMELYLQFERPLAEAELELIRPLVRRRGQHEPLQYVLGEAEFHGLKLKVDPRALIPRPETELLVEMIIARCPTPPGEILDLGTGSGAIALALAQAFPAARILATDVDAATLGLARENCATLGLAGRIEFTEGSWFSGLGGRSFDLVVSNPPYLSEQEVAAAPAEVRDFEPRRALQAADDGLADLATIITDARKILRAEGLLALETGPTQHARLLPMLQSAGYRLPESQRDLTGRDRFVFARA